MFGTNSSCIFFGGFAANWLKYHMMKKCLIINPSKYNGLYKYEYGILIALNQLLD